jgi:hypothetical protein
VNGAAAVHSEATDRRPCRNELPPRLSGEQVEPVGARGPLDHGRSLAGDVDRAMTFIFDLAFVVCERMHSSRARQSQ